LFYNILKVFLSAPLYKILHFFTLTGEKVLLPLTYFRFSQNIQCIQNEVFKGILNLIEGKTLSGFGCRVKFIFDENRELCADQLDKYETKLVIFHKEWKYPFGILL
jgi:hypothetical protein